MKKKAGGHEMFETIVEAMKSKLEELPDKRRPSNATKYSVGDAVLSAFSVFFMQSPSFLEFFLK